MSPAWSLGCWGGAMWRAGQAGTATGCLLSSSDTQYKMTISMADWPSESSEVSGGSGPLLAGPPYIWAWVCRQFGTIEKSS